jgi:hypothetical protein
MRWDRETKKLDRKALAIMGKVVKALRVVMPQVDVSDPDASMYASDRYDAGAMTYMTLPSGEHLDARVEIPSSEGYEGGPMQGWGFGFASTYEGGTMGPGNTMGNYTGDVWTKDPEEIERRLAILDDRAEDFANAVARDAVERGKLVLA